MARFARRTSPAANVELFAGSGVTLGRLVEIGSDGRPVVDFPGNAGGPLIAKTTVQVKSGELVPSSKPVNVLLAFEEGDAGRPVVIGIVRDALVDKAEASRAVSATLDDKRLELTAEREIVLRCGQGSITLTADGRIVVKGTNLVSRASGTNRIKGASVAIN
jgi:hypothetical protein